MRQRLSKGGTHVVPIWRVGKAAEVHLDPISVDLAGRRRQVKGVADRTREFTPERERKSVR